MYRFQIVKNENGWHWRLWSDNNRIICWSETYTTRQGAEHSIALVKRSCALAPVI